VLHDPPDLVGRPPARLVIGARLHLRDDPEQKKEDTERPIVAASKGSGVWISVTSPAYFRASPRPKMATARRRKPRPSLPKHWIGRSKARSIK